MPGTGAVRPPLPRGPHGALLGGDRPVLAGLALGGEVETGLPADPREVEVAARPPPLVLQRHGRRRHLARGRRDHRPPDQVRALVGPAFRSPHHPGRVPAGRRPHGELVVDIRQLVDLRMARMVVRRVAAQQRHLDGAQGHHPTGLRPAAVVADAHALIGAQAPPHRKARIPRPEILLLQAPGRRGRGDDPHVPADEPSDTCRRSAPSGPRGSTCCSAASRRPRPRVPHSPDRTRRRDARPPRTGRGSPSPASRSRRRRPAPLRPRSTRGGRRWSGAARGTPPSGAPRRRPRAASPAGGPRVARAREPQGRKAWPSPSTEAPPSARNSNARIEPKPPRHFPAPTTSSFSS